MKYQAVNALESFEYHDAEITDICVEGDVLRCRISALNINKDAPQNPYDTDMCIDDAHVTLRGFCLHALRYPQVQIRYPDGHTSVKEGYILTGEQMQARFAQCMGACIWVYSIETGKQGTRTTCEIETSVSDFAIADISFDEALIEWDGYSGKAWYEKDRDEDKA